MMRRAGHTGSSCRDGLAPSPEPATSHASTGDQRSFLGNWAWEIDFFRRLKVSSAAGPGNFRREKEAWHKMKQVKEGAGKRGLGVVTRAVPAGASGPCTGDRNVWSRTRESE